MPLTYAFRLFLAEEFSSCLDFTVEEQNGINCAVSIQNALGSTGDFSAVYNETSVYRLYATGDYTGTRESILEYIRSFSEEEDPSSAYWNVCAVS
jgi:predicted Zn-dependent peptidase